MQGISPVFVCFVFVFLKNASSIAGMSTFWNASECESSGWCGWGGVARSPRPYIGAN